MTRAALIYPHQLFSEHPALTGVTQAVLVEGPLLLAQSPWHPRKAISLGARYWPATCPQRLIHQKCGRTAILARSFLDEPTVSTRTCLPGPLPALSRRVRGLNRIALEVLADPCVMAQRLGRRGRT